MLTQIMSRRKINQKKEIDFHKDMGEIQQDYNLIESHSMVKT